MEKVERIIGIAVYASMFIPIIALGEQHDCHSYYDECIRIFSIEDGRRGVCVREVIDNVCAGIAVIWFFVIIGGLLVLSKMKNAISPFVVALLVIIVAIVLACMDPSKWGFVLSLILSFILFAIAAYYDRKNDKNEIHY